MRYCCAEQDPVEDDPENDESDDWFDRCGRTPDGTCMLAGTEECDFECPYRDERPKPQQKKGAPEGAPAHNRRSRQASPCPAI